MIEQRISRWEPALPEGEIIMRIVNGQYFLFMPHHALSARAGDWNAAYSELRALYQERRSQGAASNSRSGSTVTEDMGEIVTRIVNGEYFLFMPHHALSARAGDWNTAYSELRALYQERGSPRIYFQKILFAAYACVIPSRKNLFTLQPILFAAFHKADQQKNPLRFTLLYLA